MRPRCQRLRSSRQVRLSAKGKGEKSRKEIAFTDPPSEDDKKKTPFRESLKVADIEPKLD